MAELPADAATLWSVVREELDRTDPWPEDEERVAAVVSQSPDRSRAFFSTSAGRWDELRNEMYGPRTDLLPLLGLLDSGWTLGDLGGGTGHTSCTLAPFVRKVVLVDRSPEMLRSARSRLADAANVECRRGDLTALPLQDGELDLALLSLVLHYLPNPADALAEAARVVQPGGRVVVVDLRPHERETYREEMGHRWRGFEPKLLLVWLEQAGLRDIVVNPLPADPEAQGPLLIIASGRKPRSNDRSGPSTVEDQHRLSKGVS